MNILNIKLKNYLSYKAEEIKMEQRDGLYCIIGRNDESVDESEGNGCLHGNTIININRAKKGGKKTIKHLYDLYNGKIKAAKSFNKNTVTKVRSFNGETVQLHNMMEVVYSGRKDTYTMVLADGKSITGTSDHKIMTRGGWVELISCQGLDVMIDTEKPKKGSGNGKRITDQFHKGLRYHPYSASKVQKIEKHRAIYEAYINDMSLEKYLCVLRTDKWLAGTLKYIDPSKYHIHHKDFNHYNNEISNLECLTVKEHLKLHSDKTKFNFGQGIPEYSECVSITLHGVSEDTYDIRCAEPYHNFVANGIVVHNSGKTALISAVPFALYGRSRGTFDKELVNEDVVRIDSNGERAKKAEVEIVFEKNDSYYKVVRSVTTKGTQKVSVHSSLTYPKATWTDLTLMAGVNRRTDKRESGIVRTEQRIVDIIGCDVDLFINSIYFEQSNIDTFATGSLNDKDSIIRNAVGLNRWMDYGIEMKLDLSKTEKEITRNQALLDEYDVDGIEDKIKNAKVDVKVAEQNVKETEKALEEDKENVEMYVKRVAVEEERSRKQTEMKEKVEKLKAKKRDIEKDIEGADNELRTVAGTVKRVGVELDNFRKDVSILEEREIKCKEAIGEHTEKDLTECNDLLGTIVGDIAKVSAEMGQIEKKANNVEKAICPLGLDCEELTEESKGKIKEDLRKEWKKLNFTKNKLTKRKEKGQERIKEIENSITAKADHKHIVREIESINERVKDKNSYLDHCSESIVKLKETQEKLTVEYAEIDTELGELVKELKFNTTDVMTGLREKLANYRDSVSRQEVELTNNKEFLNNTLQAIKDYEKIIEKTKDLTMEFGKLQNKRNMIKDAQKIVRKDIPHLLIGNAIPEIKKYARKFIYKLSNGRLDLDFKLERELKSSDAKANAFDIFVNVDGKWLKYAQTSGGQRARADVAIHLAYVCFMSNMTKSRFETIFLDEVGAALDKNGVENFVDIIKWLMEEYKLKKIFNITQNMDMKKMIDNRILVTLTDEGSRVAVQ